MPKQQPLDLHQQELVNVIKIAHQNLAIARRVKMDEQDRRIIVAKSEADAALTAEIERIKMDLSAEVEAHASALDEALIAAYNAKVPIRRIALDGFGNRYDGGVTQLMTKLRVDGRIGNRVGYQGHETDPIEGTRGTVEFPKLVDMDAILNERTTVAEPRYEKTVKDLVLLQADEERGTDSITAPAVTLLMDSRDPWFKLIQGNARPGTKFARATSATLYLHPATGRLTTRESAEKGETIWDHPVARWVKEHYDEALEGFQSALDSAS